MEIKEFIEKLENLCCDDAQREENGLRSYLRYNIRKLIEQFELDERIKNGQEKIYVARFPNINMNIIYYERVFKNQPNEWLYKTPYGFEIKLEKSMFKEEKIDVDKIMEEIKKQQNGKMYDADFLEKTIIMGK